MMAIHGTTLSTTLSVVVHGDLTVHIPTLAISGGSAPSVEHSPARTEGSTASPKFQGVPASLRLASSKTAWVVYAVTQNGHLGQFTYDTGAWTVDYPLMHDDDIEDVLFAGSVVALRGATQQAREIYGVSTDGRLARVLFDGATPTGVDYPAEIAEPGVAHHFAGSPAAVAFDAAHGKRLVYAITTDGALVELWGEGTRWELGLPAAEARQPALRFHGSPAAALARKGHDDVSKHLAAVTTDDRLFEFTGKYGERSSQQFGGEERFRADGIAMTQGTPEYKGIVLAATTTAGRIVCFDLAGHTAEPARLAEHPQSAFRPDLRATFAAGHLNIHAVATDDTIVELRSAKVDDPPVLALPSSGWSYMPVGDWNAEPEGEDKR